MTPVDEFAALLGNGEGTTRPLLAAAAQVPRYADPDCEPAKVLAQLLAWGEQLRTRLAGDERTPPAGGVALAMTQTQLICLSIVAASLTSYLPGPSMFSDLTTPLSTSIEKRWQRTPMPRATRSSSSPSFFA